MCNKTCNKTWNWNISWVGSLARSCEVGLGVFDVEAYMVTNRPAKPVLKKNPTYSREVWGFRPPRVLLGVYGRVLYCTVFTFFVEVHTWVMHWLINIIYIYPSSFSFTVLHILNLMFQPFRVVRLCLCTANSCITEFEWWLIQWLLDFKKNISYVVAQLFFKDVSSRRTGSG